MSDQSTDPARTGQLLPPPTRPRRAARAHPDLYGVHMIPLTQGKFALVDEADLPLVAQRTWCASVCGTKVYAAAAARLASGKRITLLMHVLLAGFPEGCEVDHQDGNGLDNRRANLRVCTHAENGRNWTKRHHRTSRFKGVSWNAKQGRWVANIKFQKRRIYLGAFADESEAARAYDAAAARMFGEFARPNLSDEQVG